MTEEKRRENGLYQMIENLKKLRRKLIYNLRLTIEVRKIVMPKKKYFIKIVSNAFSLKMQLLSNEISTYSLPF